MHSATHTRAGTWRATVRGWVLWQGPSELDPTVDIVVIGLRPASARQANRKTGSMSTVYYLTANVSPIDAAYHNGADTAICGDCPFRPQGDTPAAGACYVNIAQGPTAVWSAYRRGRYPLADEAALEILRAAPIRLGAYGDPAATPSSLTDVITAGANAIGYTHQWRTRPMLRRHTMASVDTPLEAVQAQALGWRTFRVRTKLEGLAAGEIDCPAPLRGTQCADCGACDGNHAGRRKPHISIVVHGSELPGMSKPARYGRWRDGIA